MKTILDRIDRGIVHALQKNARLSNKELAAEIGLAQSSCRERVRKLTDTGVLRGFHAEVSADALGIAMRAIFAVRLRDQGPDAVQRFRELVGGLPEVVESFHVAGEDDFLLHVAVRDVDHLNRLWSHTLGQHDVIARVRTSLVFEHHRKCSLPDLTEET
ncbi:MAG: DNA-binding Lrp family transcriptional regulator [Bradymonadia bacterium]|jgi:DNA-binding Lrp family transcriptional regulator